MCANDVALVSKRVSSLFRYRPLKRSICSNRNSFNTNEGYGFYLTDGNL